MGCSPLGSVTVCVIYGRFEDSIRKRIGRPIRFEIPFERKKRFAGPFFVTFRDAPVAEKSGFGTEDEGP